MDEQAKCGLCGEPMPAGEEMFKYHGYSGNCPQPTTVSEKGARKLDEWRCAHGFLARENCRNCDSFYGLNANNMRWAQAKDYDLANLRAELESVQAELDALKRDAYNLKSPAHPICNENLTETLAAALDAHQRSERAAAEVARLKGSLNLALTGSEHNAMRENIALRMRVRELSEALQEIAEWKFNIMGDCVAAAKNVAERALLSAQSPIRRTVKGQPATPPRCSACGCEVVNAGKCESCSAPAPVEKEKQK